MKTIIATTDFSPVSINAVNYAADLAYAMNANLAILNIFQMATIYSEVPVAAENIDRPLLEANENLKKIKDDLAARTRSIVKIYPEVRVGNSIVPEIENYCESVKPYAVVMGTHGSGTMGRILFGSNTITAMKNLSWPLIVVPPEAKFRAIRKIGLACDMKKVVETAPVEQIRELVRQFGAELHVIHVNAENEASYTAEIIEESGLLQEMLDDLRPIYHFLNNVNVDEGLSDYAEKNGLDILIAIPKKHNIVNKLMHRSHTKELLLHTHVPVMSVHE